MNTTMRDSSIARRFTLSLILTVSIVSVITVGFIYFRAVQKTGMTLEKKADEIIAYQINALAIPLWDLDKRSIDVLGRTISQIEEVASLEIRDYFDRIAFSTNKHHVLEPIIRSSKIFHQGRYVGMVTVSLSKQLYLKENQKLLHSFLLTIFLIIVTLVVTSGILVRTFLRKPLELLNEIVSAYASGQYDSHNHYQPYIEFKPFSRVLKQMGNQITQQLFELQKAEKKYRNIFENAIEGIFQSTPEGRYLNVNPAMAEIMGYESPGEMTSGSDDIVNQFYAESEERQRFVELMDQDGRVLEFEARLIRKNKDQIIASISAQTIKDDNGNVLYYEGYLIDISRRKKAAEALRHTKEQLALLLESLPIVPFTCETDGDYGVTYVSRTIEEITGFKPEQFTTNSAFWADHVFEDDRQRIFSALPDLMATGRARHEYRFRTSGGSFRWFDDTRRLVRQPDGAISHIAGTWRDITKEKRLQKEADYRLQQVIQADKLVSLGEVAAGVAHEVNNPNSFIATNLPLLEETWNIFEPILSDYAKKNPQWRHSDMEMQEFCVDMGEIIEAIKIGSDRINRIVCDLKDFVRVESENQPGSVNLNAAVEKAFAIVGGQVRKSIGKVEMGLGQDLPTITGHFQKLEQVVANLIVNAMHATATKKQGRLTIKTCYLEKLGALIVQIEDNGVGMAPEVMERIFEPFFTLRRESGGTGLGLSVSYNLVREHGGRIGVLSQPGKGCRFTIFLPAKSGCNLELRPAILYVDDDPQLSTVLQSFLMGVGNMQILTAKTSDEMFMHLDEHPEIDIILADVKFVYGDSGRVLSQIKSHFALLSLILFSKDTLSFPVEADTVHLLSKPFRVSEFKEILSKVGRQKL